MHGHVAVWWLGVAAGPGAVAVVLAVALWIRLRRVRAVQRVLLPDGTQSSLVDRHAAITRSIERLGDRIDEVRDEVIRLTGHVDDGLRGALRFQGIVRYDAYTDIGGAQSWSMAILNADRSGAVMSSLHARDHARVYLKEIVAGVASQRLSPEEERAVAVAIGDPAPAFDSSMVAK